MQLPRKTTIRKDSKKHYLETEDAEGGEAQMPEADDFAVKYLMVDQYDKADRKRVLDALDTTLTDLLLRKKHEEIKKDEDYDLKCEPEEEYGFLNLIKHNFNQS